MNYLNYLNYFTKYQAEPIDKRAHLILSDRQTGKTTKLIKEACNDDKPIVCPTFRMKDCIENQVFESGCRVRVMSYDTYKSIKSPNRYISVYFDELGQIILSDVNSYINSLNTDIKMATIDTSVIGQLNDIFKGLKLTDIDGKKLTLKLEVIKEEK